MLNPPIRATRKGRNVNVYGTTPDGMVLIAYADSGKADTALWRDLEILPEPEIVAVAVPPALPPAHWSEWGSRRCEITGRHIHYRSRHGGTETQKVSAVDRASTTYQWSWWRDGGSVRVSGGNGFLTPKDAMAAAEKYTLLREGEPAPEPLPIAPEISSAPTPAPAVKWAMWVEVSEHRIRRPGVSGDGTEHLQTVYPAVGLESWAWDWRCGDAIIHEQEGYSNLHWARRDCEAYTAGKTAPAGPTPANAGEK